MSRARYVAVPPVPLVGLDEAQSQLLNALKENVELLAGIRGEPDRTSAALNRASLRVSIPPAQTMVQVTARGEGVTVGGAGVPTMEDYVRLVSDVQRLANDVANLRATVEVLIRQLRG
jgi:hypothetical protein